MPMLNGVDTDKEIFLIDQLKQNIDVGDTVEFLYNKKPFKGIIVGVGDERLKDINSSILWGIEYPIFCPASGDLIVTTVKNITDYLEEQIILEFNEK